MLIWIYLEWHQCHYQKHKTNQPFKGWIISKSLNIRQTYLARSGQMGKPDNQGGGYCPSTKLGCKHEMALLCQSKIKKQRNIFRMCIISIIPVPVPVGNQTTRIILYITQCLCRYMPQMQTAAPMGLCATPGSLGMPSCRSSSASELLSSQRNKH